MKNSDLYNFFNFRNIFIMFFKKIIKYITIHYKSSFLDYIMLYYCKNLFNRLRILGHYFQLIYLKIFIFPNLKKSKFFSLLKNNLSILRKK